MISFKRIDRQWSSWNDVIEIDTADEWIKRQTRGIAIDEAHGGKVVGTSRDRPKSAPYPRLKNSKRTSKCQFTVLENRKAKKWTEWRAGAP